METKRYKLRIVEKNDSENIYKILSDDEVIENLNMDKPNSLNDTNKLIDKYLSEYKKGNYEPLVIIDKKTEDFVGIFLLKLDLYNEDAYEYTTYIDKRFWNKGIVTEILKYMVKYFFDNYDISNFRGYVMEKNKASMKVLEKCGFKLEKVFKVNSIEDMIYSYLMTRYDFFNK